MTKQNSKVDPSCMDDFDPNSLSADEALSRILNAIKPIEDTVKIPIRKSLGRILSEDIRSTIDVPSRTNSAMDGYAILGSDIPQSGIKELKIVGKVLAGQPLKETIMSGTCARIMTGGVIPDGADTVVIQEHAERNKDLIKIGNDTRPGDNIRQAGEDIARGDVIFKRGIKLMPADIGLIASLGIAEVTVTQNLRIAFFSTGNELQSIGEPLKDGNIFDSNRYTLHGMLTRLGVEVIDLGIVCDAKTDIEETFNKAVACADVVITTGGVSVGEADFVREILNKIGKVNFWKVAIKPGRPLTFGEISNTYFFGLPGNPVSVMVTFYQFVQPALNKLMGNQFIDTLTTTAICQSKLKKRPGRVEYQRGILEKDENNNLTVRKTGAQGSGILSSMSQANCFIILSMESEGVEPGAKVTVQPFYGLI